MKKMKGSRKVVGDSTGSVAMAAGAAPAEPAKGGTAAAAPGAGEVVVTVPVGATWARFDLREARRAYESCRGEFEALALADLLVVRTDLQKMAMTVLTLVGRDSAPERRAVFERYAAQGNYDLTLFDRLPTLSLAAWYVRRKQQQALFGASGAAVSKEEVALAYEVRGRMLGVLQHWHGDRHDVAVDLAQVREGSGYQDLANDLDSLAEMYRRDDLRPLLEHDVKHYRASDADEALRLAAILATSLGIGGEGEAARLTGLARRAATLLVRGYEAHARCGRFFFGETEDVAETYPSLFAAVRAPQRKRSSEGPGGGGGPGDEQPGDDEPGDEPDGEPGPALRREAAIRAAGDVARPRTEVRGTG
ncbi:MAG TPA: hypothetical protein VFS43_16700 [Polyangiaceae bacterium]|nr:hypothetical protein [Polyangiaceae bacterium]